MVEPSHVLLALGLTEEQAHTAIRIGCGRTNTDEDIGIAMDEICSSIKHLSQIHMD